MPEPRRPRVPDPSATIPDFGPRPDVRVLEKRAEVIRMLEGDAAVGGGPAAASAPAPGPEPAPARRTSPLLVLVVALVVAVLAGSASFFVIVFAGLAMYALLGI